MAFNREKTLAEAQKYVEKQKYDKAIGELRKVVDADANDARTLHRIGDLQLKQNRFAEAVDTFETVGKLYAQGGFAQRAIAVYKQTREIIATRLPQAAERYGHLAPKLAELYRDNGLPREALIVLEEYTRNLQAQGRDADALPHIRQIADLDPKNPLHRLRVGEILSRTGDRQGAATELDAAATLLLEVGRRDDAIKVLERLLQHVADPGAARKCAELYLQRGRPPHDGMQALAKLQICYAAYPQDVGVLGLLAHAFTMMGQHDKAMNIQREIARLGGAR